MHEMGNIFWPRCRGAKISPQSTSIQKDGGSPDGSISKPPSIISTFFSVKQVTRASFPYTLHTTEKLTPYYEEEERERERVKTSMKMGTPFPFLGTVPMNFSTPVFPFPKKERLKGFFLPPFPLFPQGIVGDKKKKEFFRNVRRHKFRERLLLLEFQTAEIYVLFYEKSRT